MNHVPQRIKVLIAKVGLDGHYRLVRMPLYVKWTEFLARYYEYARLAREITSGCKTDDARALAALLGQALKTPTIVQDGRPAPAYADGITTLVNLIAVHGGGL